MTSINWPPQEKRKLIGTRIDRLDGPAKSSGAAKYSLDIQRPNLLYGKILGAPIAAGTLKSLDTSAAEALEGCRSDPCDDGGRQADQLGRAGNCGPGGRHRGNCHRGHSPDQGRIRTRPTSSGRYRSGPRGRPAATTRRRRPREGVQRSRRDCFRTLWRRHDHALLPGAARPGLGVCRRRAQSLAVDAGRLRYRRADDRRRRAYRPTRSKSTASTWGAVLVRSSAPARGEPPRSSCRRRPASR